MNITKCFDYVIPEHYNFRMPDTIRIDCRRCEHYHITWDTHFPYGCRLFGFKTKTLPSLSVAEATGAPCDHFAVAKKKETAATSAQHG